MKHTFTEKHYIKRAKQLHEAMHQNHTGRGLAISPNMAEKWFPDNWTGTSTLDQYIAVLYVWDT